MANFKQIETDMSVADPRTPYLIVGKPGIGKTAAIHAIANRMGFDDRHFVQMNLGQMADAADLIGVIKENPEDNTFFHMLHSAIALGEHEPIFLFFDELNRASKELRNAAMQLCSWEQTFNGHKLATGSRVVVAINPAADDSNDVEYLNKAQLTRFAGYNIELDLNEWLDFARRAKLNDLIIQYISEAGLSSLYNVDQTYGDEVNFDKACPRTWEAWSHQFDRGLEHGLYEGIVGLENLRRQASALLGISEGVAFKEFFRKNGNSVSVKKILNADAKEIIVLMKRLKEMQPIERSIMCAQMAAELRNAVKVQSPKLPQYAMNFYTWFNTIEEELRADFFASFLKPCFVNPGNNSNWMNALFKSLPKKEYADIQTMIVNLIQTDDRSYSQV